MARDAHKKLIYCCTGDVMLTLRQIEVIRAIMVAGTVNGAARLLNVSAPGVSRVMKHAETILGVRLFSRRHGRFIPTAEAKGIVDQVNDIYRKVENLQHSIESLKRGTATVFSFASVPSISQFLIPRAVKRLSQQYPDLVMNIDILKIEEAIDYLLYRRGELVAMSYRLDHPGMVFHPLAKGELVAIVAEEHPLAEKSVVSVAELARYPLIGIDPHDPYGNIIAPLVHRQQPALRIDHQGPFRPYRAEPRAPESGDRRHRRILGRSAIGPGDRSPADRRDDGVRSLRRGKCRRSRIPVRQRDDPDTARRNAGLDKQPALAPII